MNTVTVSPILDMQKFDEKIQVLSPTKTRPPSSFNEKMNDVMNRAFSFLSAMYLGMNTTSNIFRFGLTVLCIGGLYLEYKRIKEKYSIPIDYSLEPNDEVNLIDIYTMVAMIASPCVITSALLLNGKYYESVISGLVGLAIFRHIYFVDNELQKARTQIQQLKERINNGVGSIPRN